MKVAQILRENQNQPVRVEYDYSCLTDDDEDFSNVLEFPSEVEAYEWITQEIKDIKQRQQELEYEYQPKAGRVVELDLHREPNRWILSDDVSDEYWVFTIQAPAQTNSPKRLH